METGKLYKSTDKERPQIAVQLSKNMQGLHNTRMTLIDKWSIRNFQPYKCALGPDEYFFGEFGLFSAVSDRDDLIRFAHELKVRATQENVLYLEIMGTSPIIPAKAYLSSENEYEYFTSQIKSICKDYNSDSTVAKEKLVSCFKSLIEEYEEAYNTKTSKIYSAVNKYVAELMVIDVESWNLKHPFDTCSISRDNLTVRYHNTLLILT